MNRPTFNSILLLIAFVSLPAMAGPETAEEALAGGRVGNGGLAYVCRDTQKKIISARLLDLWEAEGVPTWQKNENVDVQISAAIERLKTYSMNAWNEVRAELRDLQSSIVYSERALNPTDDALPSYQPDPGCGYEQVARYEPALAETGEQGLRITSEIFRSPHFSNSDRAALLVHEAIYLIDRIHNQAENSQRTRMVVAHLFSDSPIPDAVRLATAAVLGVKGNDPTSTGPNAPKVERTIIAVADPLAVQLEVRFHTVDGIHAGNKTQMKAEQENSRYRCSAATSPTDKLTSTGWVKLVDLVKYHPQSYPRPTDGVAIKGTFAAGDFDPKNELPEFATMETNVMVRCERRNMIGEITSVSFANAVAHFPLATGLTVGHDESLRLDREGPIEKEVSSVPDASLGRGYWGAFEAAVVRAMKKP